MRFGERAVAVAAALAVSALGLTGCGSGDSGGSGTTTINYFTWYNDAGMKPIVEAFEKANPDVKVELSSANNDPLEYAQTLLTRASGRQVPDVFHLSLETRKEIIDAGLARDVTDEAFLEGTDKTAHNMFGKDGRVYGMSLGAWAGVIIYNVDLLKNAGYDTVPTDLDGFIQMGKALNASGVIAYMDENAAGPSGSFVSMLGGYYAGQGTSDSDIFDNGGSFSTWVPVIKQWQRILDEGVMPKNVIGVSGDQIKQSFMTGKLAMYRSGAWDFPDLNTSGVKYHTAPFPAVAGGKPYIGGGPDSPYALSAALTGDKLKAAQRFLGFLNSAEGLALAEKNIGQVSTSSKYAAKVAPPIADVYRDYVAQGKYYWLNWPRGGSVMTSELTAQLQSLIQGKKTPEQMTADLDAKWKSQK